MSDTIESREQEAKLPGPVETAQEKGQEGSPSADRVGELEKQLEKMAEVNRKLQSTMDQVIHEKRELEQKEKQKAMTWEEKTQQLEDELRRRDIESKRKDVIFETGLKKDLLEAVKGFFSEDQEAIEEAGRKFSGLLAQEIEKARQEEREKFATKTGTKNPNLGLEIDPGQKPWRQLSMAERSKLIKEQPEVADRLMAQAKTTR